MKNKVYVADNTLIWERVKNRRTIFIDTNVWIDVVENRSPLSNYIKLKLVVDLVKSKKIICPLSAPLIWELYKQNRHSQLSIAVFMDSVSLGVCYKSMEEIFNTEIRIFIQQLLGAKPPDEIKKIMYVPVSFYLSSSYSISYPKGWTDIQIRAFENYFQGIFSHMSLTQFIKMLQTGGSHHTKKINTLRNPQATKERWEFTKGKRDRLIRIEEEAIARNYVLPFINKLPLEIRLIIFSKMKSLPKDKYDGYMQTILASLPVLKNHMELMAMVAVNPLRKSKPSDFFDLEMLATPLAYADAVVSQDKWMRDIVCNRGTFLKRSKCKFVSNLDEFKMYLEAI